MQNTKKPVKVLRYFPLIPRLRRIYASSKIASSMRWHDEGHTKDGILRHPADSLSWKAFDAKHPEFASDIRNVRLGLASDGFNLFWTLSSTYSTVAPHTRLHALCFYPGAATPDQTAGGPTSSSNHLRTPNSMKPLTSLSVSLSKQNRIESPLYFVSLGIHKAPPISYIITNIT